MLTHTLTNSHTHIYSTSLSTQIQTQITPLTIPITHNGTQQGYIQLVSADGLRQLSEVHLQQRAHSVHVAAIQRHLVWAEEGERDERDRMNF